MIRRPKLGAEVGCHDITVFPQKDLAVGACWTKSFLWDIADPAKPKVVSRLRAGWEEGHHSAAFTWDGRVVALGHEDFGCGSNPSSGAMALFDVTKPGNPRKVGTYALPRMPRGTTFCWTHNFSTIPMRDRNRYVAVSAYYSGGLSVVDLSDPARPIEVGHYLPRAGDADSDQEEVQMWSAYWYQGRIYTNDWYSYRGVRVFEMAGTGRDDAHFFRNRLNPQVQVARFRFRFREE